MSIEKPSHEEQQAPHQEWNLDALLQNLDMAIRSLVDLAEVVDRAYNPEYRPRNQQIHRVFLQPVVISFLHLRYMAIGDLINK